MNPSESPAGVTIVHAFGVEPLDRIMALRFEVLRKPHGLNYESARFPNDELPTTLHLWAETSGETIGCVTLMFQDPITPTTQLRGMAVRSDYQRAGIGRLILNEVYRLSHVHKTDLWCNARESAFGFYLRNGWTIDGPMFEIPIIGKHAVMRWGVNKSCHDADS